jgi:hypothetical protein
MCSTNHLTSLPELPDSLQYLDCNTNHIRNIPSLPVGFVTLGCEKNPLETLPELPPNLTGLTCDLPMYDHTIDLRQMAPETVQTLNKDIQAWTNNLIQESKKRSLTRCKEYKEEIMMKTWHPSRVEKLLEMGYDIEDM